ncbi:MAG: peptidoglycan-binding domain-containing protein [Patescibacteria group bacterium]
MIENRKHVLLAFIFVASVSLAITLTTNAQSTPSATCPLAPPVCPSSQTLYYIPDGSTCVNAQMKCRGAGGFATTRSAYSSSSFSRGSRGASVLALQQSLITAGFLKAGNATGFFGALTEAAVKQFQGARGIVSSGSPATTGYGAIGPKTRRALEGIATAIPDTGANSTPVQSSVEQLLAQVALLQKRFAELGGTFVSIPTTSSTQALESARTLAIGSKSWKKKTTTRT